MVKKLKLHEDGQLSHHRVDDRLEPVLRHLGSGSLPSMAEETARCVRVEEAATQDVRP
jgi:hypothetical protein